MITRCTYPAIFAMAFFALPAGARDIQQCNGLSTSHSALSGHMDMGGGVVRYRDGHFGYGQLSVRLVVESCNSGAQINVTVKEQVTDAITLKEISSFDVVQGATAVLDLAHNDNEAVTFDVLAHRLSNIGAVVKRSVSTNESCACSRAYPQLRGTKKQFEWYG